MLGAQIASFLLRHLSLPWIILYYIQFVSYKHDANVLFSLSKKRIKPELHV